MARPRFEDRRPNREADRAPPSESARLFEVDADVLSQTPPAKPVA